MKPRWKIRLPLSALLLAAAVYLGSWYAHRPPKRIGVVGNLKEIGLAIREGINDFKMFPAPPVSTNGLPILTKLSDPPAGSIVFTNVRVLDALVTYQALTGLELIIDSRATNVPCLITLHVKGVSNGAAIKLIEQVLRDQARVVITPLDGKRASVTYDDVMTPTGPSKHPKR